MQNDNVKFKIEFKKRLYNFVLKLIAFIDKLPNDVEWFINELDEIAKIFASSILTLKGRK